MKFHELDRDADALVLVATLMPKTDAEVQKMIDDINTFATREIGFFRNDTKVVSIEKIEGNVLGEEGRSDLYLKMNKFDVNPIARLKFPDFKWVSDFIDNYVEDYE